jgi:4-amino-4-deoxy-L-arabinose transferase-like glycosyltransferase
MGNVEVFLFILISSGIQIFRQSIHVDEGRYLSSAFEMYSSGNYLIPHLNGVPYHHKPPMLLWITNLLWAVFGVSEFVARLIPIFSTVLTSIIIRSIADRQAQLMFLATGFVFAWSQFYMFDTLMMLWVSLGWYALVKNRILFLSFAVSCGLLTKGPVLFIYLIPLAFFLKRPMIFGFLGGVVVPLLWLVLALVYGDEGYREAILWKQTAGRMVNSFHHQRGWWFYLVMFPVILFPWVAIPKLWQKHHFSESHKTILKAITTTFLIFQLISCKQIHYLLPMLPMAMIIISDRLQLQYRQRVFLISMAVYCGILILSEYLIQQRYPFHHVAHFVDSTKPVTVVTHRYRGELGFLLRQRIINVMSEEDYNRVPQTTGQFIIFTEQLDLYPNAIAVFERKAGHYLLVVVPESTRALNSVT